MTTTTNTDGVTIVGRDRDGDLVACTEFVGGGRMLYPLTPCCKASGKGGDSLTGVVCRSCYEEVDGKFGGVLSEREVFVNFRGVDYDLVTTALLAAGSRYRNKLREADAHVDEVCAIARRTGNVLQAARLSGIARSTIIRRLSTQDAERVMARTNPAQEAHDATPE